jgi:uncharacterized protein YkwD
MTARGSRGSSLAVSVLVTVLAVAGAIVLVIRLPGRAGEMAGKAAASAWASPASEGVKAVPVTPRPSPASARPARAHPRHRSSPRPAATGGRASPGMMAAAPTTAPPAGTAPPASGQPAATGQVLALINQARAQAGLPAYTISSGLDTSASRHTAVMAGGCGLSHQCPGEPPLGDRETAAGAAWTAAGENIGEGGPVADTSAAIAQMAVGLTQSMLDEKPPDDGHRLNILSSAFTHIGISVYRDSSGTVWMTQDFSN